MDTDKTRLRHNPRDFKTPNYGMNTFGDLFTSRQLVALTTLSDLIQETREQSTNYDQIKRQRSRLDYTDAVITYLAFAVDRSS